jgi:hypothetical protein
MNRTKHLRSRASDGGIVGWTGKRCHCVGRVRYGEVDRAKPEAPREPQGDGRDVSARPSPEMSVAGTRTDSRRTWLLGRSRHCQCLPMRQLIGKAVVDIAVTGFVGPHGDDDVPQARVGSEFPVINGDLWRGNILSRPLSISAGDSV